VQHAEFKLTDELERKLIQREIDGDSANANRSAGVFVLELVVGTLLLLGTLLVMVRV